MLKIDTKRQYIYIYNNKNFISIIYSFIFNIFLNNVKVLHYYYNIIQLLTLFFGLLWFEHNNFST